MERKSIAVVLNPVKVDIEEARATLQEVARSADVPAPTVVETTEDDPGFGQTRAALASGASVVCALGGDGTVRAVAQELVGTGV
ncbi:MAG TPA: diacylglycerol kinase family protein, partial [Nocardioides sp.]|nr:diacylglycerol kinase family protein [Nocardioides sp.]